MTHWPTHEGNEIMSSISRQGGWPHVMIFTMTIQWLVVRLTVGHCSQGQHNVSASSLPGLELGSHPPTQDDRAGTLQVKGNPQQADLHRTSRVHCILNWHILPFPRAPDTLSTPTHIHWLTYMEIVQFTDRISTKMENSLNRKVISMGERAVSSVYRSLPSK